MSQGRHQKAIQKYRKQLFAQEKQAVHQLEAAYAHILQTLQPALNHLYQQIGEKLETGEEIPPSFLYEANRLETIKQLIQGSIDHFGALSQAQVAQMQQFAAQLGQESAHEMLQATVPDGVRWSFGIPSPEAIQNIIGATQAGTPLSDLFTGFGSEAADLAGKALIRGVALGYNPRRIAREVQDALGVSRARALTLCRTEMIRSYRAMQIENFRANDDVVSGWTWVCALSKDSCAACVAMHGTHHSLDETLDEHPSGSCTMVPDTKSWADILGPGIDTSGIPETNVEIQSGADWFSEQDAETQRGILGPGKYAAWKDGQFDFADIVGYAHSKEWGTSIKEKPLKELVNT